MLHLCSSLTKILHLFILFSTFFLSVLSDPASCLTESECGANSNCSNQHCKCNDGYITYLLNATECNVRVDTTCGRSYCEKCHPAGSQVCVKCVNRYYINTASGSCVSECVSGFQLDHESYIVNGSTVSISRLACNVGLSTNNSNWVFGLITAILLIILMGVIVTIVVLICTRYGRMILFTKHKSFQLKNTIASKRHVEQQSSRPPPRPKPPMSVRNNTEPTDIEMKERNNSADTPKQEGSIICNESTTSSPSKDTPSINFDDPISAINPLFEEEPIDPSKIEELFNEKLTFLKSKSQIFLQMLNDMRHRLKELPNDHPTVVQYRSVMRDVTRLLYLLNKKSENVDIPPDGLKLLDWAHRILDRYELAQRQFKKDTQAAAANKDIPATPLKSTEPSAPRMSVVLGDQDETKF